jgi:hypothetical protein
MCKKLLPQRIRRRGFAEVLVNASFKNGITNTLGDLKDRGFMQVLSARFSLTKVVSND